MPKSSNWLERLEKKPKLRTYQTFKRTLQLERYLSVEKHIEGRYLLTRIRSGTNSLRIETGRRKREQEVDRICRTCVSGDIENERHFILNCTAYTDLREDMFFKF